MKAMTMDSIFRNMGRLNAVIELKPGQIFSGKVLALYPNDLAQIQLAGRKINAQLLTGLTRNENYWFQVKRETSGGIPVLEVVDHGKKQQMPTHLLGASKNNPDLQRLISSLTRDQFPITKELILQSEKWLSQVVSTDKAMQAVKTIVAKNLPLNDEVFKALYHVQDERPLATEIQSLKQSLENLRMNGESGAVEKAITRVFDTAMRGSAVETMKQLIQLYTRPSTEQALKSQIENLFRAMDLDIPSTGFRGDGGSTNTNNLISDQALLNRLNMKMSVPQAELLLQQKLSLINTEQMKLVSETQQLTLNTVQKPQFNLVEIIRSLGLTFERDLVHSQLGELKNQHQLKGALVELLSQELPGTIRDKAEVMVHRLTGQQLLHSSDNQSLTSLFYQFPIHFKEWKSDVMMRWDMKRDQKGEINEDFSRILFYLDLQFLKETVVDMNVQNRVVSIKIINENQSLEPIVTRLKTQLKIKLGEIDYRLSSVKMEQPSLRTDSMYQTAATGVSLQGVDLTI